jgi:hypothetical protein
MLVDETGVVRRDEIFLTPIIGGYFENAAASIIFNGRCDCNSAAGRIPQR